MPDFSFFEIGTRRKLTLINPKGQNTQYMSLQQIVVKNHPLCTGWATSSAPSHSNKSLCVYWRISAKIFVSAAEFCCRKMLHKFNLIDSVRLDTMTKFCCGDKICAKILQYTQSDLSLQLVAWCVPSLRSLRAVFEKHSN